MNNLLSSSGAAKALGMSRDSLMFALRTGAPEPRTPRLANRRVFSQNDVEALREYFQSRRDRRHAAHA